MDKVRKLNKYQNIFLKINSHNLNFNIGRIIFYTPKDEIVQIVVLIINGIDTSNIYKLKK